MTRDEIEAALEWADWLAMAKDPGPTLAMAKVSAPTLAAAVRSLRETVTDLQADNVTLKRLAKEFSATIDDLRKKRSTLRETVKALEEEIARLKGQLDDIGKWHAVNPSLDQALNEGDGSYKP